MSVDVEKTFGPDDTHSFAARTADRDIVIITGCNAVGKTSASCYLQKNVSLQKTHSAGKHIADSQSLLEAMRQDDQAGGFHHTHDWCKNKSGGHSHKNGDPFFPFTVVDNQLPNAMRSHFFQKLETLQAMGELCFVEWAAGVNTNSGPLSQIDYSYAAARKHLEETRLASSLLDRILAVVHIEAQMNIRLDLNKKRSLPSFSTEKEIERGTAFWQKDQIILQFYGEDDFDSMVDLFKGQQIPIFTLVNDGTASFFDTHLKMIAEKLSLVHEYMSR